MPSVYRAPLARVQRRTAIVHKHIGPDTVSSVENLLPAGSACPTASTQYSRSIIGTSKRIGLPIRGRCIYFPSESDAGGKVGDVGQAVPAGDGGPIATAE